MNNGLRQRQYGLYRTLESEGVEEFFDSLETGLARINEFIVPNKQARMWLFSPVNARQGGVELPNSLLMQNSTKQAISETVPGTTEPVYVEFDGPKKRQVYQRNIKTRWIQFDLSLADEYKRPLRRERYNIQAEIGRIIGAEFVNDILRTPDVRFAEVPRKDLKKTDITAIEELVASLLPLRVTLSELQYPQPSYRRIKSTERPQEQPPDQEAKNLDQMLQAAGFDAPRQRKNSDRPKRSYGKHKRDSY